MQVDQPAYTGPESEQSMADSRPRSTQMTDRSDVSVPGLRGIEHKRQLFSKLLGNPYHAGVPVCLDQTRL